MGDLDRWTPRDRIAVEREKAVLTEATNDLLEHGGIEIEVAQFETADAAPRALPSGVD